MEHDAECEFGMVLRHMKDKGLKVRESRLEAYRDNLCLCWRRDAEIGVRPQDFYRLIRRVGIWALLCKSHPQAEDVAISNAVEMVLAGNPMSAVGVKLPEEVVEVDFRNRARVTRSSIIKRDPQ